MISLNTAQKRRVGRFALFPPICFFLPTSSIVPLHFWTYRIQRVDRKISVAKYSYAVITIAPLCEDSVRERFYATLINIKRNGRSHVNSNVARKWQKKSLFITDKRLHRAIPYVIHYVSSSHLFVPWRERWSSLLVIGARNGKRSRQERDKLRGGGSECAIKSRGCCCRCCTCSRGCSGPICDRPTVENQSKGKRLCAYGLTPLLSPTHSSCFVCSFVRYLGHTPGRVFRDPTVRTHRDILPGRLSAIRANDGTRAVPL